MTTNVFAAAIKRAEFGNGSELRYAWGTILDLTKCGSAALQIMKTYSVSGAARVLKVSRSTLQRWVRGGFIPAPAADC